MIYKTFQKIFDTALSVHTLSGKIVYMLE